MSSTWNRVTWPFRALRWRFAAWSAESDRQFHDDMFAPQRHDAFSPSYPGHLTIRRFADLAAARFDGVRTVLDLGCGPGEITCELARRRPDIQFRGFDHSAVGVERARANAARLELTNVRFDTADLDAFTPGEPVDLILMFDAFHHVLDPAAFLARVEPLCSRFFLIEPKGRWTGQWDRDHDLDWIAATVFQIVDRLEHEFPVPAASGTARAPAPHDARSGEPTEHRYTMEDFERIFDGYALDVRGTAAGLELYGARPYHRSALRDRIGDAAYALLVAVEDALYEEDLDLAAKHWAIYASRGGAAAKRREPRLQPPRPAGGMLPAYGVRFGECRAPSEVRPGEQFQIALRLTNTGWIEWISADPEPIHISYHWLDAQGRTVFYDGQRTPLAAPVPSNTTVDAIVRVAAPSAPEAAMLAIDLVHEGVAWFSDQGVAPLRVPIRIRAAAQ